jgi:hypothetical protein
MTRTWHGTNIDKNTTILLKIKYRQEYNHTSEEEKNLDKNTTILLKIKYRQEYNHTSEKTKYRQEYNHTSENKKYIKLFILNTIKS